MPKWGSQQESATLWGSTISVLFPRWMGIMSFLVLLSCGRQLLPDLAFSREIESIQVSTSVMVGISGSAKCIHLTRHAQAEHK